MSRVQRLVLALVCAVSAVFPPLVTASQPVSCAVFADAPAAQAALEADPTTAATLDLDGDGRACEERFDPEPNDAGAMPTGFPLSGGPDVDCIDLVFQEIAQNVLERNPGDPFHLDPNGDGFACSSLPSMSTLRSQPLAAPGIVPAVAPGIAPTAVPAVIDVPVTPVPTPLPNQGKKRNKPAAPATTVATPPLTPVPTAHPEQGQKKGKKGAQPS